MSIVRNTLRDLVEKRLWPVALLLVAALVAVPVIGGGGASDAADEQSIPMGAPAAGAAAADPATNPNTPAKATG